MAEIPLFSFTAVNSGGYYPVGTLTADVEGNIFGVTAAGGDYGEGSVYELVKTATGYASTTITIGSFFGANGQAPEAGLIADANGDLFGTTYEGGASGFGTVFEIINTANGYVAGPTTLYSFTNGADGGFPLTGLFTDAEGNLYGTTTDGGASGQGTLFEIAKTADGYANTVTPISSFVDDWTQGSLVADANGDLFGTTGAGGSTNQGSIFEITKSSTGYAATTTTIYSFTSNGHGGATDGNPFGPEGGLYIDSDGNLIGTTTGRDGVVFELAKTANGYATTATVLFTFDAANGATPYGPLIADAAGNLYGTTEFGGSSQVNTQTEGTVFEIAKTADGYASLTTLYTFYGYSDGGNPDAALYLDANGDLFGTTTTGGSSGKGTVFEISSTIPSGRLVTVVDGQTESNVTVAAGGVLFVEEGGLIDNVTVQAGGILLLANGSNPPRATNVVVQSGGYEILTNVDTTSGLAISDWSANIASILDGLQVMATGGELTSISLFDGSTQQMTITFQQLSSDAAALALITGPYLLSVTGVSAANVVAVLAMPKVRSISITDTAANISSNIDYLQTLAVTGTLTSVTITGANSLVLTATQLVSDAAVLELVQGAYPLTITNVTGAGHSGPQTVQLGSSAQFGSTGSGLGLFGGQDDTFTRLSTGQLMMTETDGSGGFQGMYLFNFGSSPLLIDGATKILGTGLGNLGGLHDIFGRNANGQLVEWEVDSSGTGTGFLSFTYGQTSLQVDTGTSVVGTGLGILGGQRDIFGRNSVNGQLVVWEVTSGGTGTGFQALTYGSSVLAIDTQTQVIGTGLGSLGGQRDIFGRNASNGQLVMWELNAAGNGCGFQSFTFGANILGIDANTEIVGTGLGALGGDRDIFGRNAITGQLVTWEVDSAGSGTAFEALTYGSGAFVVDPNISIMGTGLNFFTTEIGGRDIFGRNIVTDQLAVWEVDGSGNGYAFDALTFDGSPLDIDGNIAIAGTGRNILGDGLDIFGRDTITNQLMVWELNASGDGTGFADIGFGPGTLDIDGNTSIVGTGLGVLGQGVHDIFGRNAATGQLEVWELGESGIGLAYRAFNYGNGAILIDGDTSIIGTGNGFLGGGEDIFARSAIGRIEIWELDSNFVGRSYQALTNGSDPFMLTTDSTVIGATRDLTGMGEEDLFIRNVAGVVSVDTFNQSGFFENSLNLFVNGSSLMLDGSSAIVGFHAASLNGPASLIVRNGTGTSQQIDVTTSAALLAQSIATTSGMANIGSNTSQSTAYVTPPLTAGLLG